MMWAAVIVGSLGCYAEKLIGYFLPQAILENATVRRVFGLIPVALLSALVAVQTFATGQSLDIDARAAGLVVAIIALVLRAQFLVVVIAAAVTAAGLRALGWAA